MSCSVDVRQNAAPASRRSIELRDCGFATYITKALCGKIEVLENPSLQEGRKIVLNIVVLPALEATPAPDPVFYLAGGPGQGAAKIASAGEDKRTGQFSAG
jgi:hypothetical protein